MAAGDFAVWEDIADLLDPVVCSLTAAAVQSIGDDVETALQFGTGSTVLDTHGSHSESVNNTRITPPRPGWYEVGGAYFTAGMGTPVSRSVTVRKNGSTMIAPGPRDAGASITSSKETSTWVEFDGVNDYVELMARQNSSGAVNTVATAQQASTFWCVYRHRR